MPEFLQCFCSLINLLCTALPPVSAMQAAVCIPKDEEEKVDALAVTFQRILDL